MDISMKVNGELINDDVAPNVVLVDYLRSKLGLTGAKVGCETGHCGACTVRLDGRAVKSCQALVAQLDGSDVDTIEGVATDGELTSVQQALQREHGAQCGFCTPGMVMSLGELLENNPKPDEAEVRTWLAGNLCRCTGYQSIVRGVLAAANESQQAGEQAGEAIGHG